MSSGLRQAGSATRPSWAGAPASGRRGRRSRTASGQWSSGFFRSGRFGGTVQEQPVHPETPSRFGELLEVDRLDDVAVNAEAISLDQVTLLVRGGEHHDRDRLGTVVGLDAAQ